MGIHKNKMNAWKNIYSTKKREIEKIGKFFLSKCILNGNTNRTTVNNKHPPIEKLFRKDTAIQYRRIRLILREAKRSLSLQKQKVRTLCENLLSIVGQA